MRARGCDRKYLADDRCLRRLTALAARSTRSTSARASSSPVKFSKCHGATSLPALSSRNATVSAEFRVFQLLVCRQRILQLLLDELRVVGIVIAAGAVTACRNRPMQSPPPPLPAASEPGPAPVIEVVTAAGGEGAFGRGLGHRLLRRGFALLGLLLGFLRRRWGLGGGGGGGGGGSCTWVMCGSLCGRAAGPDEPRSSVIRRTRHRRP